ncbi:MetQ/NlpA family ABC transporter substrate-binding protein [Roseomonas sp. 18066]|uniref:MetQ/NlpA family ABC transporter substrate-binding protein n=1 Tax=Roseomonas sp. 18066 TaxID=2681412 RepID=UPI00190F9EC1|nr:MetQ/NlpA family ABC transporter substrate-binding protein [Roseomonas sp. 18066]
MTASDRRRRPILTRRALPGLGLALLAGQGAARAQEAAGPLRIALATSISNQAIEAAAAEAKAQGLAVRLTEFADWVTPNRSVFFGEQDANLFQHRPYLTYTNAQSGWNLVPVAPAYATAFGLYSKRHATLAALPEGARIGYSGDVINTGRSLMLLRQAGLLRLRDGAEERATPEDILDNPRRLRLVSIDGPQIARTLDELDAAVTYPTFARLGGLDPDQALTVENDPRYAFHFVARPDRAEDARLRRFIRIYQNSDAVKAVLRQLYGAQVSFPDPSL